MKGRVAMDAYREAVERALAQFPLLAQDGEAPITQPQNGGWDEKMPPQPLRSAMRYSLLLPGKRLRPVLLLAGYHLVRDDWESALPFACAMEMIHTYSLIHDDLPCMDNDDFRRGKPTNHKQFGEATALLAGDSLLTYAFGVAVSGGETTAEQNIDAVKLLSSRAGFDGMAGGQMLDLIGEKEKLTYEEFMLMNQLKTGCLIKAACLLGCIAAGYREGTDEYAAAEKYAENVGLAFQIEDDILDEGTEDNKTTFLTFMTVESARNTVDGLTGNAKEIIAPYDRDGILSAFADMLAVRKV